MTTAVHDLMSSPAVTCAADALLAEASSLMDDRQIGSVVVTDRDAVVGILTERDLLRASATRADPRSESVRRWMTADPDVLGVDDEVGTAWSGLTHHHYRHLPVVDHGDLVGVVSIRDLLAVAQIRPTEENGPDIPRGLEGVVAAETSIGDVRGAKASTTTGSTRPRTWPHPARSRTSGNCSSTASSPTGLPVARFAGRWPACGSSPRVSLASCRPSPRWARRSTSCAPRCRCSGPSSAGGRPTTSTTTSCASQALRLCAVVPTILTAAHRLAGGEDPIPPRPDLSYAANYLWMLSGQEAPADRVRAVEQYLILTIDHGFNASTFTARVIASTGADLAAAVTGAVGALSGPLHGGRSEPCPRHARRHRHARSGRGVDPAGRGPG